jgi:repressor LexA
MTERQREMLNYIAGYIDRNGGVSPSFDEMQAALGLKSKSGVHRLIVSLEKHGRIKRLPGQARSIVLPSVENSAGAFSPERQALLKLRPIVGQLRNRSISQAAAARRISDILAAGL